MPKMKTCKAISKRVKITGRGKVKCYGMGRRHLLSSKTTKRKRGLRRGRLVVGPRVKQFKQSVTYLT